MANGTVSNAAVDFHVGRVVQLTFVAALGGFLFGYDTAVINGAVSAMAESFGLNAFATGFAVSSALLGCMVGALLAGNLAARIGRVRVMIIAAVLFVVSALGSGLAFGVVDLIIWRIVGGIGIGAASVIAPAYIAEVSPAHVRGRLGSMQQMAIVIGIFMSLLVDFVIALDANGADSKYWLGLDAWRWMFIAAVVPALVYGLLAFTIPESPRFLVQSGQETRARNVLSSILGEGIDERISEIKKTIRTDKKSSFRDVLRPGGLNFQAIVWVGIILSVFQQFVGINVIFYYSTTLWQAAGFNENDSFTITVLTSVTNVVVTAVAIVLIDKIGRRKLLLIGSAGMFVSLTIMTLCFTVGLDTSASTVSLIPGYDLTALLSANAFVVFFGMSWGPGVWVLLCEMFNNRIRSIALGIAASAQWLANFAISTTFPAMANVGLWFAYGFYALAALASFFFVLRFITETKGRELEDM